MVRLPDQKVLARAIKSISSSAIGVVGFIFSEDMVTTNYELRIMNWELRMENGEWRIDK